jgi:hypothetical protein
MEKLEMQLRAREFVPIARADKARGRFLEEWLAREVKAVREESRSSRGYLM